MRICIPTETQNEMKAKVSHHFGSAAYFMIYDTETKVLEKVANTNQHHSHGACHPMQVLSPYAIDAVVCQHLGRGAISKLQAQGIKTYGTDAVTVADVIEAFKQQNIWEITAEQACGGHGCH